MKSSDRYIVTMPAIKITKVTVDGDTPIFQEFTEFGGVTYPGMTYQGVLAIQSEYAKVVQDLVNLGLISAEEMEKTEAKEEKKEEKPAPSGARNR